MTIPPRKPSLTSLAAAASEARAIAGGSTSRPPLTAHGTRKVVLVVDDDATARAELVKALSSRFDVVEAKDGIDAIEKAGALPHPPALIVTDVNMPRLDGFNMVKVLKGHPLLRHVSVIFYSARSTPSDVVTGIQLGVRQFITKSIGATDAAERIFKLVA